MPWALGKQWGGCPLLANHSKHFWELSPPVTPRLLVLSHAICIWENWLLMECDNSEGEEACSTGDFYLVLLYTYYIFYAVSSLSFQSKCSLFSPARFFFSQQLDISGSASVQQQRRNVNSVRGQVQASHSWASSIPCLILTWSLHLPITLPSDIISMNHQLDIVHMSQGQLQPAPAFSAITRCLRT